MNDAERRLPSEALFMEAGGPGGVVGGRVEGEKCVWGGRGGSSCVKLKSMRARVVFCISNEQATLKKISLLR